MSQVSCLARVLIALSCALAGSSAARAEPPVETEFKGDATLLSDFRELNQSRVSAYHEIGSQLFSVGTQFRVLGSGWLLEARPELRGQAGHAVALPDQDPARLSLRPPDRLLRLDRRLYSDSRAELYGSIEKLALVRSGETSELYLGRRPVSLGVLKVFPVWNKFTRPLPIGNGLNPVYSSDGAGARVQSGATSYRMIGLSGPRIGPDSVVFGETSYYGDGFEIQALGANWWQQPTFGVAGTRDWGGLTLRGELLQIGAFGPNPESQTQLGLGGEYALDAKWTLLAEAVYYSHGASKPDDYTAQTPSKFLALRANRYGYVRASYQWNSFWNLSSGVFMNWVDSSLYLIPKVVHSLAESADLSLEAKIPIGPDGTEFSKKLFTYFPGGASIGAPLEATASLNVYF